jgi:rare lipoprotein A
LPGKEKVGFASWYGDPYHGRHTSNGEIYNKFKLTAAHRTLPFDTLVKVNNLENGKSVKVRINDRGPFVENRIIDLSYAAAQRIAMDRAGIAKVRLAVLKTISESPVLTIQIGSFKEKVNAEKLKKQLSRYYRNIAIEPSYAAGDRYFRVLVGQFSQRSLAEKALRDLQVRNYHGLILPLAD